MKIDLTPYIKREVSIDKFATALARNDRTHQVLYDIETRPGSDDLLRQFYEEDPKKVPPDPGEWDESVHFKPGNAKKADTLEAKKEQQRQAHILARSAWKRDVTALREQAWLDFKRACQLNPWRCEVAAIGYGYVVPPLSPEEAKKYSEKQLAARPNFVTCLHIDPDNPVEMLRYFKEVYQAVRSSGGLMIAHNGDRFDLPVLQTRSVVHGILTEYFNEFGKTEPFHLDTSKIAVCHRYGDYISLKDLCYYLGVAPKSEEIEGKEWWEAYCDDRRDLAIAYLRQDIESLYECALRLHVL